MTLRTIGGFAALLCAATYLFGFALLVTLLAPLGDSDPAVVVGFIEAQPGLLTLWYTVIYVVNALALAVLVVAIHALLRPIRPDWAGVTRAFGLIWATLVLGAGMIANVAVERTALLAASDPVHAAQTWEILQAVELGLGGGNEIAGGIWILCVSVAGLAARVFGKLTGGLGLLTGAGGLATVIPFLGETAGAIFGLGAIAWFIAVGVTLLRGERIVGQASRPATA